MHKTLDGLYVFRTAQLSRTAFQVTLIRCLSSDTIGPEWVEEYHDQSISAKPGIYVYTNSYSVFFQDIN